MTKRPFIPYAKQTIDASDLEAVSSALTGEIITRGDHVVAFEDAIADYCEVEYAVAFNSASTALLAACYAAGTQPGDYLLTSPNTFVASVAAGMHHQATPILVDIDRNTGNLDLKQVAATLEEKKRSRGQTIIMPVHFSGIPVDMQALERSITSPNTVVIEDAAHAIGSCYPNGQRIGCCAWSDMTVFSFHPAKTITTGEGGMVTTSNPDYFARLQRFRNNGIERDPHQWTCNQQERYLGYYEVSEISNNYNFTDFQAALGLSQLKKLDQFIEKRRELVRRYRHLLKDMPHVRLFTSEYDEMTAFHLFVIQIDFEAFYTTRMHVMQALREHEIGTQVHYIPIYRQPFFEKISGSVETYFPEMEGYFAQALSLPLYYTLQIHEVDTVVQTLKDVLIEQLQKGRHQARRVKPKRR